MKTSTRFFALGLLLSSSAFANIYSSNLWTKKELRVCFGDQSITPTIKRDIEAKDSELLRVVSWETGETQNVRLWIEQEYSEVRTGVHFVGWESCADDLLADIVIFRGRVRDLDGMVYSLGPTLNPLPNYPSAQNFIYLNRSGLHKGTVVHETGHLAGLAHEHMHPDIKDGCDLYPPARKEPGFIYEPYDPSSIMDYCMLHGGAESLSDKDVDLLKRLYP